MNKVFLYFVFIYFSVKTMDKNSIIITINKVKSTCIARQHVNRYQGLFQNIKSEIIGL